MMRIPPILRAHSRESLAAVLVFILLMVFWPQTSKAPQYLSGQFWPQPSKAPVLNHDLPPYPGAQNLSHELPSEPGERFRTCGRTGEEIHAHTRITRFVTSDSPDTVLQFYAAALVDRGPYVMIDREHTGVIGYGRDRWISDEGERALFEYEVELNSAEFSMYHTAGYRVVIDAAPEAGRTTVQIIEHEYERFSRACHL